MSELTVGYKIKNNFYVATVDKNKGSKDILSFDPLLVDNITDFIELTLYIIMIERDITMPVVYELEKVPFSKFFHNVNNISDIPNDELLIATSHILKTYSDTIIYH
jgi:hypothetical protein